MTHACPGPGALLLLLPAALPGLVSPVGRPPGSPGECHPPVLPPGPLHCTPSPWHLSAPSRTSSSPSPTGQGPKRRQSAEKGRAGPRAQHGDDKPEPPQNLTSLLPSFVRRRRRAGSRGYSPKSRPFVPPGFGLGMRTEQPSPVPKSREVPGTLLPPPSPAPVAKLFHRNRSFLVYNQPLPSDSLW